MNDRNTEALRNMFYDDMFKKIMDGVSSSAVGQFT